MVIVLKVTAAVDAIGTTQSWWFTDHTGWTTRASDTPALTHISPRLLSAGHFERDMFASGLFGAIRGGWGEFVVANADGRWLGDVAHEGTQFGFDGRPWELWASDAGGHFPSDFAKVGAGTMRWVRMNEEAVTIVARDEMDRLAKPVLSRTFAGTGGLEGDSSLAGKRAPRAFGDCLPLPCTLVDAGKLIYHVCDGISATPAAAGVFDGGVPLSMGAVYTSTTDLQNNAPAAGQARFFGSGPCYVRLGSAPAYDVSCAPSQIRINAGAAVWLSQLALDAGVSGATGSVISVEDYLPLDSSDTYQAVMARACRAAPSWFGFDALGGFVASTISDPVGGSPVFEFTESLELAVERDVPPGVEVPVWQVQTKGRRNWMAGRTLAGAAPGYMRREWYSSAVASDAAVQAKHAYATDLSIESPRYSPTGAAEYLALHKADRDFLRLTTPMTAALLQAVDLGDVVSVKRSRFGMSAGKRFLVTGIRQSFADGTLVYSLWG